MTIAIVLVFSWFLAAGSYPVAQRVRQAHNRRDESQQAMVYLLEDIAWVAGRTATLATVERDRRSAA